MAGLGAALLRATEGWRSGEEETRMLQDRDRAIAERELRLQALRDQMSAQQEMRPMQIEQARLNLGESRRRNQMGAVEDEYRLEALPEVYAIEGKKRSSLGKTLDAEEAVRTKYEGRGGVIGDYGSMAPKDASVWELRDAQMRRELNDRIRLARTAGERNRAIQDKQNWIKLATLKGDKMPGHLEEYALGRQDALSRMRELQDTSASRKLSLVEADELAGYKQAEKEYRGFISSQEELQAQTRWARRKLIEDAAGDPDALGIDLDGGEEGMDMGYGDPGDAMADLDNPALFDPAPERPRDRSPLAGREPPAKTDKPRPLGEVLRNARQRPAPAPTDSYSDRIRDFLGLSR